MADPRRQMVADPSLTVNDVIMTSLLLLKFINVFSNFYLLVFFSLSGKIDGTWILPPSNRIILSTTLFCGILVAVLLAALKLQRGSSRSALSPRVVGSIKKARSE